MMKDALVRAIISQVFSLAEVPESHPLSGIVWQADLLKK